MVLACVMLSIRYRAARRYCSIPTPPRRDDLWVKDYITPVAKAPSRSMQVDIREAWSGRATVVPAVTLFSATRPARAVVTSCYTLDYSACRRFLVALLLSSGHSYITSHYRPLKRSSRYRSSCNRCYVITLACL